MHNLEYVLENEMYKGLWDFEIQTDHLISTRQTYRVIVNKRKEKVPSDLRVKLKESEKRYKYLNLAWELKKTVEYEGDGDTDYNWYTQKSLQKIGKATGKLGN